jgi:hypothetical protein
VDRQCSPARRKSRQELVQIASPYFEAIEDNDGKGYYPFTDDCDRLENGALTSNRPGLIRMGEVAIGTLGCKAQFSTGLYGVVTDLHSRRFPITVHPLSFKAEVPGIGEAEGPLDNSPPPMRCSPHDG